MEMTRREFFKSIFKIAAAAAVGIYVFTDKASIKAFRHKKYPGSIKQLPNIFTQGKWRG
jgi:hypothetical protein